MGIRLTPFDLAKSGTEYGEQTALMAWVRFHEEYEPKLKLLFAIPNGGQRSAASAAKAKAEGVKKGVSDLMLPVARHGYHGLWLEMKRLKGGSESKEQKEWAEAMKQEGYAYCCCHGWAAAAQALMAWLEFREQPWLDDGRFMLAEALGPN